MKTKKKSPWADMKVELEAEPEAKKASPKNLGELEVELKAAPKPQIKQAQKAIKRSVGAAGTSNTYKKDQVRHTLNKLLGKE